VSKGAPKKQKVTTVKGVFPRYHLRKDGRPSKVGSRDKKRTKPGVAASQRRKVKEKTNKGGGQKGPAGTDLGELKGEAYRGQGRGEKRGGRAGFLREPKPVTDGGRQGY